jgi:hypothetical protein
MCRREAHCDDCGETETLSPLPLGPYEHVLPIEQAPNVAEGLNIKWMQQVKVHTCQDGKKSDIPITTMIILAPEAICLGVERSKYVNVKGRFEASKIEDDIGFSEALDLSDFLSPSLRPRFYKISSIILHRGQPSFGHYVALVRLSNDKWALYNDATVTEFATLKAALEGPDLKDKKSGIFTPAAFMYVKAEIVEDSKNGGCGKGEDKDGGEEGETVSEPRTRCKRKAYSCAGLRSKKPRRRRGRDCDQWSPIPCQVDLPRPGGGHCCEDSFQG